MKDRGQVAQEAFYQDVPRPISWADDVNKERWARVELTCQTMNRFDQQDEDRQRAS